MKLIYRGKGFCSSLHKAKLYTPMARRNKAGPSGCRRRSPQPPADRPLQHFVKIIHPSNLQDKKLRLPKKFANKYGDELCEKAEVVGPKGRSWRMRLTRDENHIWFDGGWGSFMKHHSIDEGYLFVFRYKGSSNFSVLIFDKTGCEIQYEYPSVRSTTSGDGIRSGENSFLDYDDHDGAVKVASSRDGAVKVGDSDEDISKGEATKRHDPLSKKVRVVTLLKRRAGSQEIWSSDPADGKNSEKRVKQDLLEMTGPDASSKSRRGMLSKHGMSSSPPALLNETKKKDPSSEENYELLPKPEEYIEIMASGFSKASQKSKSAIHAARMFKPKNPNFMVLLRPYNIYNNYVNVPAGFATRYLHGASKYVRLEVSDGRQWPLSINRTDHSHTFLAKGWHEFSRENELQEGDVWVFELIMKKNLVLKVSIFRAGEDSST